jgi:N-acetylneuraminic acid mutarotase
MPSDLPVVTAVVPDASGRSFLYAIVEALGSGKVMAYDVTANRWTTKAPRPQRRVFGNGAGVINGRIYLSGGFASGWVPSARLELYDPATNTWSTKRSMPGDGYGGITGVHNGKLYVLTSCDVWDCYAGPGPMLYRYNPATDEWATLASPANEHQDGVGGFIGGKFYVAGGEYSAVVEVYDPAGNRWETRKSMPKRRWGGAGTTLGAKLYVTGGSQQDLDGGDIRSVRTTLVYDPATDRWSWKAPMPERRDGISASRVTVDGKARLEVVGGSRPGNNLQYLP